MTEPLFHVIADGRAADGFEAAAVAQRLQQQLKLTAAQAARLLAGSPVIAKRGVARTLAEQYCTRLGALGLRVHIEPDDATGAPSPSTPSPITADDRTIIDDRSAAPDWPGLADLFRDVAMPLAGIRSVRHRLAIIGAGAQLVILVAAYCGLAALAALALIAYSASYFYLLTAPPLLFSIPVFLLPWLMLLAANLLLLRPLLPMRTTAAQHTTLQAAQQPQLFCWLKQLCRLAAVPMPNSVAIGAQTTHAVQLADQRGALWRGDYRLLLSLPLLETASLRDNTALVAALLATQAAGASLRCSHVVYRAGARLETCRENRDWLGTRSECFRLPRALLALHNRLLAPFAVHLETLRQRLARSTPEEADRLYATLAGTAGFADSLLLHHKLEQAARDADALNSSRRIDGLAADLPALIRHYYDHCDPGFEQRLRKQWREVEQRSPRAALPTEAERIEAVQTRTTNGVLGAAAVAPSLAQRDALARALTVAQYVQAGLAVDAQRLLPMETLAFAAADDLLQREQTAPYFNKWFRPFRFWRMTEHALVRAMPIGDAVQQLNVCVSEIRRLSPDRARLLHDFERLQNQLLELLVGQQVLAQGQPYRFRNAAHDGAALQPLIEEQQAQLAKVTEQLGTQETIMGGRISLALRLCGAAERDTGRLHRALQLLGGLDSRLYKLALDLHQLEQLVQRHHQRRESHYAAPIRKLEEKIDGACLLLRERLKEIPYPLDTRHATLDDFIDAQSMPLPREGKSAALERATYLLQQLHAFNEGLSRSAASLGTVAEEAYRIEPIRLLAGA